MDITKAEATAAKASKSPVQEAANGHASNGSDVASSRHGNGAETGLSRGESLSEKEQQEKAQSHLTASAENLLASLRMLSSSETTPPAVSGQKSSPQPREEVNPQEKQMQRSVVGSVSTFGLFTVAISNSISCTKK